jgi:hypothetical protein
MSHGAEHADQLDQGVTCVWCIVYSGCKVKGILNSERHLDHCSLTWQYTAAPAVGASVGGGTVGFGVG